MENPVMPKVSNMELTCIGKEYAAPIGSQAIVARRATTSGYITLERLTPISSMEAPSNGATMENSATACPINWHKITPRIIYPKKIFLAEPFASWFTFFARFFTNCVLVNPAEQINIQTQSHRF